jgi:hypothetical protein
VPLTEQVARGVARLRDMELAKPPGVAEAISWATALHVLGADGLDAAAAQRTAGAVLKYAEDMRMVRETGFAALAAAAAPGDGPAGEDADPGSAAGESGAGSSGAGSSRADPAPDG